jgi:hypothetical protein
MKSYRVWFNEVLLPTYKEPQRALFLTLPRIYLVGVSCPTNIGIGMSKDSTMCEFKVSFVVLGFGIVYSSNWDI